MWYNSKVMKIKEQKHTSSNTKSAKASPENETKQTKKILSRPALPKRKLLVVLPLLVLIALGALAYMYRGEFILATVNGKPITRAQLWKSMEQQGGIQTLDSLITQELILQKGAEQKIVVTQQDIDAEILSIQDMLSAQGMTLEEALAAQRTTLTQLEEQIKLQITLEGLVKDSITVADSEVEDAVTKALAAGQEDTPELRDQVRNQLEQSKLSQAVQGYLATIKQDSKVNILNDSFIDTTQSLN